MGFRPLYFPCAFALAMPSRCRSSIISRSNWAIAANMLSIKRTGRLRRVAELAAEKAGWGRQLPKGHGLGGASQLRELRCHGGRGCRGRQRQLLGAAGAAMMGLSLAKYGEITLKKGRVEQSNFSDFPVVRIDESPTVTNTHIVENGIEVPSSGVGEPGVPPLAPALCNAIFAATGKRIRRLPIGAQIPT